MQGVFYRAFAAREANRLGLVGVVRNLPDGTVEVIAEGTPAQLDLFIGLLRKGPPAANVGDVTVEWSQATGTPDGFRIDLR